MSTTTSLGKRNAGNLMNYGLTFIAGAAAGGMVAFVAINKGSIETAGINSEKSVTLACTSQAIATNPIVRAELAKHQIYFEKFFDKKTGVPYYIYTTTPQPEREITN